MVTMALSCMYSDIERYIGRKAYFFHTPFHSTPPLVWTSSVYCHPVSCGKARMVALADGEKTLRICVTV